jgi:hypothetical protein
MASRGNKEHRMVFDIRGRRKHVVKAVYAVLAVLMGASLFLVVGPVNIGSLLGGNSGSSSSAGALYEEEAERIEQRLKKDPENAAQLLALTRARIHAGESLVEETSQGLALKPEGRQQYERASESWSEYLEATAKPNPTGALQMAQILVVLAETSPINEAKANLNAAMEAQKIAAEAQPNLNSLSTLALLQEFNFEYAAAKKTGKEASKYAHSKFERENFENQLEETEKRAKEFQKQLKETEKAAKTTGTGKESLENPLGGAFGGGAPLGE